MTYFLETSTLGFRNWLEEDFQLVKSLLSNPEVTQELYGSSLLSDQEVKVFLNTEMDNVKKFGVQIWPFFSLNDDQFIGVCGLRPYKLFDGIFELSIQVLPEYHNMGHGFQASSAMLEYTINTLNIKSLFAGHTPQNTIAAVLLKKLGFQFKHMEFHSPTGVNHLTYILNA